MEPTPDELEQAESVAPDDEAPDPLEVPPEVPEADALEQAQPVPLDEEDTPR